MSLTREDLENGVMLRFWQEHNRHRPCKTAEQLDQEADRFLAEFGSGGDPWVFGYGSLIWNPLFDYAERVPATLDGFHRRFCLWSKHGRGSPDNPGLVLGLDRGGSCCGVAFRIPRAIAARELRIVWRREMISDAYSARWLPARAGEREVRALALVINPENEHYAGKLSIEQMVETIATAAGRLGSSRDYLYRTVEALREHGVCDPMLDELHARVNGQAALEFPDAGDE